MKYNFKKNEIEFEIETTENKNSWNIRALGKEAYISDIDIFDELFGRKNVLKINGELAEKLSEKIKGTKMKSMYIVIPEDVFVSMKKELENFENEKIKKAEKWLSEQKEIKVHEGGTFAGIIVDNEDIDTMSVNNIMKKELEAIEKRDFDFKTIAKEYYDESFDSVNITYVFDKSLLVETVQKINEEKIIKEAEKEAKRQAKFKEAKNSGKKVLIRQYVEDCNNKDLECNTDIVKEFAMPDGSIKIERTHTY